MSVKQESILSDLSQKELFKKIGDICAVVNTVITAKDLLEISLRKTLDLFGATRGSIFIVNKNGVDLILKAAVGMKRGEKEQMVKRMGEGIVGKVAQFKSPIYVNDISQDHRFRNFKARGSYNTPSFICSPLLLKDQLIGVINITDKESGQLFNESDLQLLDFLSSQIALNYRRIQLYQKLKKTIKETRNLKDRLGQSDQETANLKKQIVINERLATIGKLAGGIAHEFNNPLDGVMRYTNLCLEHVNEDDVVRGYLLEIKHGLHRMAKIVKNLLDCSHGGFAINKEKIDCVKVIERAIASMQTEISHKNIKIIKDIDKELPLILDLGLERIILNLIRNAVEATYDKGEITVSATSKDNMLILEVKDTGCGIPSDKIEQIFEPFFTTKDIEKGCGLGLTIVGEIVKSYDGKINVESTPGKGTQFTVVLPIQQQEKISISYR